MTRPNSAPRQVAAPTAAAQALTASSPRLIRKLLVANRGEIACRVFRACREMGIATVAVFSDADATARHTREADEAVRIGESAAAASYLNIPALLAAARRAGADAIHPGYGFLAEHAAFAAACREAGLLFIGPTPEVIARMGDKREARRLMAAAGVPVAPGYDGSEQTDKRFLAAAREIGYPIMVKASAGGGGKGMRVVAGERELTEALAAARREAKSAFGDDTLLLEKATGEPRHIEFQIFGDEHGHLIQLGERECSLQRRHQKVIEETPSVALTPELRERMAAAAVTVGEQLRYTNAGTVEFMLAPDGRFYFLEVNTRLQVEHPVTELVTGIDLVRWQLLVAEGRPLPLTQEQVRATGHAVEARLYAEDPLMSFFPASGTVALWREPHGAGVRVDAGVETGDRVSVYYDPLLAKISAHGATRIEALRRLERALAQTTLLGVRNNGAFLRRALLHPAHVAGDISTNFIERYKADLLGAPPTLRGASDALSGEALAVLAAALQRTPTPASWRNNRSRPLIEQFFPLEVSPDLGYSPQNTPIDVRLIPRGAAAFDVTVIARERTWTVRVIIVEHAGPDLALEVDGHRLRAVALEVAPASWWARVGDETYEFLWRAPLPAPGTSAQRADSLAAPMPGQVIALLVREGQRVRAGEPLLVIEAMKMEHTIRAPHAGVIAAIHHRAGEQVAASAVLLDVRAEEAPPVR